MRGTGMDGTARSRLNSGMDKEKAYMFDQLPLSELSTVVSPVPHAPSTLPAAGATTAPNR